MHKRGMILVAEPNEIALEARDLLAARDYEVVDASREIDRSKVDGLFIRSTRITSDYLENYPKVSYILCARSEPDNIDHIPGVNVYCAPASNANTVAEFVVSAMIGLLRNIPAQQKLLQSGRWRERSYIGTDLSSSTIGLIGYGAIGHLVAQKLYKGHDVKKMLVYDRSFDKKTFDKNGVEYAEMPDLLERSDIVSLHVPGTDKTKNMIGAQELARMKASAFLINTARGKIVNEVSLIAALKEKRIAGVHLDVFPDEPNINPELLALAEENPNIVLTPHIAAYTEGAEITMSTAAVENFFAGRTCPKSCLAMPTSSKYPD